MPVSPLPLFGFARDEERVDEVMTNVCGDLLSTTYWCRGAGRLTATRSCQFHRDALPCLALPCLALPCLALSWWARRPSSPHCLVLSCLVSSRLVSSRIRRAPRRWRDPYALPCSHSRHNTAYYTASTRRFSFLAPHRVACLAVCARARHQRVVPVVNRTAGPPRSRRHARMHASREAGTNSVRRLLSAIGRPGARWLGARSGRFVLNLLFFGTADRGRDATRRDATSHCCRSPVFL